MSTALTSSLRKHFKENIFFCFNGGVRFPERELYVRMSILFASFGASIANNLSKGKKSKDWSPSVTPLISSLCKQTLVWYKAR